MFAARFLLSLLVPIDTLFCHHSLDDSRSLFLTQYGLSQEQQQAQSMSYFKNRFDRVASYNTLCHPIPRLHIIYVNKMITYLITAKILKWKYCAYLLTIIRQIITINSCYYVFTKHDLTNARINHSFWGGVTSDLIPL